MSPPISTGESISLESERNAPPQIETSVATPVAIPIADIPIAAPVAAHASIPIVAPIAVPIAALIATPIAKPKSQKDRLDRKITGTELHHKLGESGAAKLAKNQLYDLFRKTCLVRCYHGNCLRLL